VGEREAESGAVSVRPYFDVTTGTIKGVMPTADFIAQVTEKARSKWHPAV